MLAALAGILGATAFTHSAGYFVTFMTGNSQRAVLGLFGDDAWMSVTASLLILFFVAGVVIASVCRRHFWAAHPHGPTVLTTFKMGQGIERHLAGGKVEDWLGYFLLHASFVLGAAAGGAISMVVTGPQMLAVAAVVCAATTGYTYLHADRRGLVNQKRPQPGKRLFRALRRGELDSGTSTPATNYGSS